MNKKAQGEVITTVLIILLVLAAIVIVWQVVNSTIKKGSAQIEAQSGCVGLSLVVTSADATTKEVKVTRESGGPVDAVEAIIFVNGVNIGKSAGSLKQLESGTLSTLNLTATDKVQVAAKLADGTACALSTEVVVK